MSTQPYPDPATPSDAGLPALERLRVRIEEAAAEIERLRAANASLAERVQELTADAVARADEEAAPALKLAGDPEDLRKKVESFIEAIDQILAEPGTPVAEAEAVETGGDASPESAS